MGQRNVERLVEEIRSLPASTQDRIATELVDLRMDRIVRRLRKEVKARRLSAKEIQKIVSRARREFHDARRS